MPRRFEFQEGNSSKFWEIELDGSSVTTCWGRIGTSGQNKTKDFGTPDKARKEYDKLVEEKTGKGYEEVGGGSAPRPAAAAPAAKVAHAAVAPKQASAPAPARPARKAKDEDDQEDDEDFDDEFEDEDDDEEADDDDEAFGSAAERRRFEFQEGNSSKFWEIELGDCSLTTWWGKIGTAGQSKTLEFDSEDEAQKQYDKLVLEKTKKGYEEV